MNVMKLPPRSPDLNVLDYSLWHEIYKRLRRQEARFPKNKTESKAEFLKRLRRVAFSLPPRLVCRVVQSMKQSMKRKRKTQSDSGPKDSILEIQFQFQVGVA